MTAKKCTKKCDVVVLLIQPIDFLTFLFSSPSWHLKVAFKETSTTAVVDAESWGEYDTVARQIDFKVSCLFASAVCKTQEDVIIGKPLASIDYE